jgi:hypothetical protein
MPDYNSSTAWIEQAIGLVRRQTVPCTHYMVAEGITRDHIKIAGVEDIRLPVRSNDGGATPRTMGEREAIDGGHEFIAYLDANGVLEPNFVEEVLRAFDAGFDCVDVSAPGSPRRTNR